MPYGQGRPDGTIAPLPDLRRALAFQPALIPNTNTSTATTTNATTENTKMSASSTNASVVIVMRARWTRRFPFPIDHGQCPHLRRRDIHDAIECEATRAAPAVGLLACPEPEPYAAIAPARALERLRCPRACTRDFFLV